jgi:hypothetical protein
LKVEIKDMDSTLKILEGFCIFSSILYVISIIRLMWHIRKNESELWVSLGIPNFGMIPAINPVKQIKEFIAWIKFGKWLLFKGDSITSSKTKSLRYIARIFLYSALLSMMVMLFYYHFMFR